MDRCAQKDQLLRDFRFFIFHKVAIDVVGFPPSFLARMFSAFRLMFIGFRVTSNVPVISFAALVLLSLPASAGPPFITDDPQPVEYQHYEQEFRTARKRLCFGRSAQGSGTPQGKADCDRCAV
jgi:hypothetical protein